MQQQLQPSIDTIISSSFHFIGKWNPELRRTQADSLLRLLIYKLYDSSRGNLFAAEYQLSQQALGAKLGLSRVWINALLAKLSQAGWIRLESHWCAPKRKSISRYSIGPQLKRLLIMLRKSPQRGGKNATVKRPWQFSPTLGSNKTFTPVPDKEVPETVWERLPLLKTWLKRGNS